MQGLVELQDRHPIIGDVRGRGLFLGFELVSDLSTLEPATEDAGQLVNEMRRRGALLSTDGPHHNVIKIKPPMVLKEEDIDTTLEHLEEVLTGL